MADKLPHTPEEGFIGVFDSGVGGVSVLRHLVRELPAEDFRYFGDSANNPYGDRSSQEVLELTSRAVEDMVAHGAKAIVIACNTATSAAAPQIRAAYPQLPIVGVEPALKPAVLAGGTQDVLVMATAVTLALDKYHRLAERWAQGTTVRTAACVGLAERIERGHLDEPDLLDLLERLVGEHRGQVDRVVLGCTHYPFVRHQIEQVLGDVRLFDGGLGTAHRLRDLLRQHDQLADDSRIGRVSFASSNDTPEQLALYRHFFELESDEG